MSMSKAKVLDKVKKLLNLSEGTCYEEEAQSAMLMAQALLLEHGLTMEQADSIELQDGQVVVEERMEDGASKLAQEKLRLAKIICPNFRITLLISRSSGRANLLLIGLEADVAVCREVLSFCFASFGKTFHYFVKKYKEEHPEAWDSCWGAGEKAARTRALRVDYLEGYLSGLRHRFQEQVEEKALVLTTPALVKQHMAEKKLGHSYRMNYQQRAGNGDAFTRGHEDGKRCDHSGVRSKPRAIEG